MREISIYHHGNQHLGIANLASGGLHLICLSSKICQENSLAFQSLYCSTYPYSIYVSCAHTGTSNLIYFPERKSTY
ncbi:hypothetical protein SLEP1_g39032 [Rubroshorea leprosula]|uniref:Uncharacterized protein n=1 Tax=Rubroshorea leprosula TaxID=152421 RepID=A0AAV5KYW5_9ROSI|nr:hypothetical protein SLEP1_g39032 [Rubroshorea leprosula]